jgi:hypothetical protein
VVRGLSPAGQTQRGTLSLIVAWMIGLMSAPLFFLWNPWWTDLVMVT